MEWRVQGFQGSGATEREELGQAQALPKPEALRGAHCAGTLVSVFRGLQEGDPQPEAAGLQMDSHLGLCPDRFRWIVSCLYC